MLINLYVQTHKGSHLIPHVERLVSTNKDFIMFLCWLNVQWDHEKWGFVKKYKKGNVADDLSLLLLNNVNKSQDFFKNLPFLIKNKKSVKFSKSRHYKCMLRNQKLNWPLADAQHCPMMLIACGCCFLAGCGIYRTMSLGSAVGRKQPWELMFFICNHMSLICILLSIFRAWSKAVIWSYMQNEGKAIEPCVQFLYVLKAIMTQSLITDWGHFQNLHFL